MLNKITLLNDLVDDLISVHVGGELFFDNLDEALRGDISILEHLFDRVSAYISIYDPKYLILSGKFGRVFSNFYALRSLELHLSYKPQIIVLNSGIRLTGKVEDFSMFLGEDLGFDENFIFVDDSFYSGTTRDAIRSKIESYGGMLIRTFVLYDGSNMKDPSVDSFYRYYDNHDVE